MMGPEFSLIFLTHPLSLFQTRGERRKCTALKGINLFYQTGLKKSEFRAAANYTLHLVMKLERGGRSVR